MLEDKEEILQVYAKAINQIDDLFEYRYKTYTNKELKTIVMAYIDNITTSLEE